MCSLLKQDVLSYAKTHLLEKHCISLFQQFQHLRCAVMLCILSNQEDSPSKWSNCRTKACVLHPFGLCEYTVVSRISPFLPELVIQAAEDFSHFDMCFKVKMLNFLGRNNSKYGGVWSVAVFVS